MYCTLALLAGNMAGDAFPLPAALYLASALIFSLVVLWRPRPAWALLCLALLGAAGVQVGRMPGLQDLPALTEWAGRCKAAFSAWLGRLVPDRDAQGLLQALAIGDRSGLSRELRDAYRDSGAMHLLALSGLHVGLVYAMLRRLLAPLGGFPAARLLRGFAILGFLWTYAVITGLSASIVRAVLMLTFYEVSSGLYGSRDGLSTLAASAFLLILFRPESPRDIGFQLSYAAVLSILLLHPRLSASLQTRSRLLGKVWELLSISICCQATCGILAWLYFGTFPRYFLLTTLLAVPLTPVVLYAAAAAVAAAGLAPLCEGWRLAGFATALSDAANTLLQMLLHLLNTLIRLIASL